MVLTACLLFVTNSIAFYGVVRGGGKCCCGAGRFVSLSSVVCHVGQGKTKLTSVYVLSAVILIVMSSAADLCLDVRRNLGLQCPGSIRVRVCAGPRRARRVGRGRGKRVVRLMRGILGRRGRATRGPRGCQVLAIDKVISGGRVCFGPRGTPKIGRIGAFSRLGVFCTLPLRTCGQVVKAGLRLTPKRTCLCTGSSSFPCSRVAIRGSKA